MRRAGWGWRGGALALAVAAGLRLPAAGQAQTEVEKAPPSALPSQQSEFKKGHRDDSPAPAKEPAASGWSAEVTDRAAVAATATTGTSASAGLPVAATAPPASKAVATAVRARHGSAWLSARPATRRAPTMERGQGRAYGLARNAVS